MYRRRLELRHELRSSEPTQESRLELKARSSQRRRYFLPIWSCSVWGLPCPRHYWNGGALLPHLFTLTAASLSELCHPQKRRIWACRADHPRTSERTNRALGALPYKALTTTPRRYVFCGTFRPPGLNLASRTLSGTLLCGVRTFLSSR